MRHAPLPARQAVLVLWRRCMQNAHRESHQSAHIRMPAHLAACDAPHAIRRGAEECTHGPWYVLAHVGCVRRWRAAAARHCRRGTVAHTRHHTTAHPFAAPEHVQLRQPPRASEALPGPRSINRLSASLLPRNYKNGVRCRFRCRDSVHRGLARVKGLGAMQRQISRLNCDKSDSKATCSLHSAVISCQVCTQAEVADTGIAAVGGLAHPHSNGLRMCAGNQLQSAAYRLIVLLCTHCQAPALGRCRLAPARAHHNPARDACSWSSSPAALQATPARLMSQHCETLLHRTTSRPLILSAGRLCA